MPVLSIDHSGLVFCDRWKTGDNAERIEAPMLSSVIERLQAMLLQHGDAPTFVAIGSGPDDRDLLVPDIMDYDERCGCFRFRPWNLRVETEDEAEASPQ